MTEKDERHFCISLAGRAVAVDALYTEVYSLCNDYLSDLTPDIQISIDENDLAFESIETKKARTSWNNGYLETLAVYRKISEAMLDFDTFLMHGAVVAAGGEAYMFTAPSGTGKTTHIRKWIENDKDAFVVNGDKPLIKVTDTRAIACGTPWRGKESLGANVMAPLKAVALMERGEDNAIEEISFGRAFTFLLQQTYRPADADRMRKTLALLSRLNGRVRFFRFVFNNLKDDAFEVSYNAMTKP